MSKPVILSDFDMDKLMHLLRSLGYPFDSDGLCFGFSHMLMQAILADDIANFTNRLRTVSKMTDDEINNLARTLNNPDLIAFCDGLQLYHSTKKHTNLFEKTALPITQNADLVIPITLPKALEKKLGIVNASEFTAIFTQDLLQEQMEEWERLLTSGISEPIVFMMSNASHTMLASYHPTKKEWIVANAREQSDIEKYSNDYPRKKIAHEIMYALFGGGFGALTTQVYSVGSEAAAVKNYFNTYKDSSVWKKINDEQVKRSEENKIALLYLLIIDNHTSEAINWLNKGVNPFVNVINDNARGSYRDANCLDMAVFKNNWALVVRMLITSTHDKENINNLKKDTLHDITKNKKYILQEFVKYAKSLPKNERLNLIVQMKKNDNIISRELHKTVRGRLLIFEMMKESNTGKSKVLAQKSNEGQQVQTHFRK